MTDLANISLDTTGSIAFLIALIFGAVAFSYFVYRKTVPPVPKSLRMLLMVLRAVAVVLVVLLLFKPILSITLKKQEKPVVAVLMDRSASMALVDQKMDRSEVLKETLQSELFNKPPKNIEMEFYPFSHQLFDGSTVPPDSIDLSDDGTDIRRALVELKDKMAEKYFGSVILITDGANNLGENPARYVSKYGLPIYPIAIGDSSQQKDVLITNYVTNEIAYEGTRVPIDIYLKSSGFEGKRIPVNLVQNNKTLDSKVVTLTGNELEQKVRLHFTPEKEGLTKYTVNLPKLEGELTQINNTKSFYVKVLKSKVKVLIVAGGPSTDFRFLKRALTADENVDVQTYVEKRRGRFYRRASLPPVEQMLQYDCLVILDYPRRSSSRNDLNSIKSLLARGKPAFFHLGKNVDFEKLWLLQDFLPFAAKPVRGQERSVYIDILPQGLHHPLFRLSEDELENRQKWQELPPIFSDLNYVKIHPNAQSLAAIEVQRSGTGRRRNLPLFAARTSGNRKSVTLLGYGLWRWDLLMWGVGKTNESYRRFLRNTIRWLITQEDSKLVRITPNKEIYRSGEEVKFIAQVYFEDYRPVDGAEVVVQLSGGRETQELSLTNIGEGRYEGSFQVLEGGDYQFTGTAHKQGRVLGRDSGKFSVEEFSLEYQTTRMNDVLLKRIAAESGGTYFTPADFRDLEEKLSFPEKYVVINNEWEIWNKVPLLITCILFLSAEWFIRKRKGML
ncbi:hypothetical protein GWO43_00385 [candidate division KSB1 bacterium]|nr:hypothetical protein [candidate division KSB1 bacterium]NIR68361.1 hypothetical protein [candidate division KSB1 bacterium]NIS22546.1 hypothetical protein [candidate division KSB1 bacterium]NIT69382.1 hypothetical protein [candidate division KSB1 bacterium]NIU23043.1 hypothetical protein [candidate division KSB1 bacterium]